MLAGDYLAVSSDRDYATLPSTQDIIICTLTKEHMGQIDTALYPVSLVICWVYTLFTNAAYKIK